MDEIDLYNLSLEDLESTVNNWEADKRTSTDAKVKSETQEMFKRLKNKCKNCENTLRTISNNLEKHPTTQPKQDYCEQCYTKCKPVLHHTHLTGKFVQLACIHCNHRFVHNTI